ncbi:RagB/SusD family nutrient uptake outer membrane protein [Chitinophaga lutea]|uniref:RagB/SusD family nutrient uptake outer membrane protein n=1 Tax=Chitinophaga lutea TaxID=2488634 RepID=A0A3N4QRH7_9BACT|nr:RagB/SusD family nutrient uptake outer membrane protein [Chitinophaga lutea]RPE14184.1 RagB/SusD family nutrient uptake outer membrane protein [Chitinophaga lutea]
MKHLHILFIGILLTSAAACKKFVDTPVPKNEMVSSLVFSDDKTATASVVGMYSTMNALNYQYANVLMSYLNGMLAGEVYYFSAFANYDVFSNNALLAGSSYVESMWADQYRFIYQANSCIEGLTAAPALSASVRSQLLGEAYFMRAFMHFYLVNMYDDVPLILSTDYKVNNIKPREKASVVYDTIINDLKRAKGLMADDYPAGKRTRPNKAAATALLARAYLYTQKWAEAEAEASAVLGNNRYALLPDPNAVFLAESKEAIWQLQSVNVSGGRNTWEGFTSVPATATGTALFRLDSVNLIHKFEPGDRRYKSWVDTRKNAAGTAVIYYFPYKYKVRTNASGAITENSMVMRVAEQYLIRAEARIQQNKLTEGRSDLDSIRKRAELPVLPASLDKAALLLATEKERQMELFAEWGHRWFDLKRTGRAPVVMKAIRGDKWQDTDVRYPIPASARASNIHLTQNEGYN